MASYPASSRIAADLLSMAISNRGKTTPASNAGSYAPYAHAAPEIDLEASAVQPGVEAINDAITEWKRDNPGHPMAAHNDTIMARAAELQHAKDTGSTAGPAPWTSPDYDLGAKRDPSAQAFVDAMSAGRERGMSSTAALAGHLRDQARAERPQARAGRWSHRQVSGLKVGAKVQHVRRIGMYPATPGSDADPHYEVTDIRPNGIFGYSITLEARNGAPEDLAGTKGNYQGWQEFKVFEPTKVTSIPDGSPATRVAALQGKPYETWISEGDNHHYIADDGAYVWVHPDESDPARWFIDGEHADGTPIDGFADSSAAAISQAADLLRTHR